MKDEELATILEAMRAAQAELAAYLNSADPDAELTLAKLVGHSRAPRGRQGRAAAASPAPPHRGIGAGRSELMHFVL